MYGCVVVYRMVCVRPVESKQTGREKAFLCLCFLLADHRVCVCVCVWRWSGPPSKKEGEGEGESVLNMFTAGSQPDLFHSPVAMPREPN